MTDTESAKQPDDDGLCSIWISGVPTVPGSDKPSACLIDVDGKRWFASPDDVFITGHDLILCAAYADLLIVLVKLAPDATSASGLLGDLISRTGRTTFGTPATFELVPAGSSKAGLSRVVARRGGKVITALAGDTARQVGRQWLEVAASVGSDEVIVAACKAIHAPDGFSDLLFAKMRSIRKTRE